MRISRLFGLSVLCLALLMSSVAFAGNSIDVRGRIVSVDAATQSFVVKATNDKEYKINTNPQTEMEIDFTEPGKFDQRIQFGEIKVGDAVKVESVDNTAPTAMEFMAEEVTVFH